MRNQDSLQVTRHARISCNLDLILVLLEYKEEKNIPWNLDNNYFSLNLKGRKMFPEILKIYQLLLRDKCSRRNLFRKWEFLHYLKDYMNNIRYICDEFSERGQEESRHYIIAPHTDSEELVREYPRGIKSDPLSRGRNVLPNETFVLLKYFHTMISF
jgi:hypothetical protein